MWVLLYNPNLYRQFVLDHPNGLNGEAWIMLGLAHNPKLNWQFVLDYPKGFNGEPWNIEGLSRNPNLDWQYVLDHPNGLNGKAWDMDGLSVNSSKTSRKVFFSLPFTQKECYKRRNKISTMKQWVSRRTREFHE